MTPKTGTRRQQSKAHTRRLILEAAHELFEEKGYEHTTMRALAARAGVGLGTIFQHFPDKSALLLAAFTDDLHQAMERGFASLPDADLKTQLLHLVRYPLEFYAARPHLARAILKEAFFAESKVAESLQTQEEALSQKLATLFARAQDRGELRRDVDLGLAVTALWAHYFFTLLASLRAERFEIDWQLTLLDGLFDQLLAGIAAPRAEDKGL